MTAFCRQANRGLYAYDNVPLAIREPSAAPSSLNLQLWPTHAFDIIHFEVSGSNQNIRLVITSVLGTIVEDAQKPITGGHDMIDIRRYSPGMYYLRVQSEKQIAVKPFFITR